MAKDMPIHLKTIEPHFENMKKSSVFIVFDCSHAHDDTFKMC